MKISTVKKDFMRNATSMNAQKAARAAGDCGGTCIKDPAFCRTYPTDSALCPPQFCPDCLFTVPPRALIANN